MTRLNLIWAQGRHASGSAVIGHAGRLPWHLPEDMAHFKQHTMGCPVIMGRKTWDSLPPRFRPLPGRRNIVLTRRPELSCEIGLEASPNLDHALQICELSPEVWVIGGAQVYSQALALAHRALVTEIDASFEGDAFAPVLSPPWRETARQRHVAANGVHFSFVTYEKP